MQNYLQIFISLFAITNPLLALSIYLNITKDMSLSQKKMVVFVCGVTVFVILSLSLLIGQTVLALLDIHPYALQLGGGIIILLIGITTVLKPADTKVQDKSSIKVNYDRSNLISLGVSPLALPMIVGPGGIALSILYGQGAESITAKFIILGVIFILTLVIVSVLLLAGVISRFMGELGMVVLNKMMGLLLSAIAFEMLIDGLKEAIPIIMGTRIS